MNQQLYMTFDVEAVGLHGDAFAVGWVVTDNKGAELDHGLYACEWVHLLGTRESRQWVGKHVPQMPLTHKSPQDIREGFWQQWMKWKEQGALLVADCPWPVEARFLVACIEDARKVIRGGMAEGTRDWEGPYPLIDVASVRLATGCLPLAHEDRLPNELPHHNPLADARQSARLLHEALNMTA